MRKRVGRGVYLTYRGGPGKGKDGEKAAGSKELHGGVRAGGRCFLLVYGRVGVVGGWRAGGGEGGAGGEETQPRTWREGGAFVQERQREGEGQRQGRAQTSHTRGTTPRRVFSLWLPGCSIP